MLSKKLVKFREEDVVVYALPRGGVVLGFEVAVALGAPLDLAIARKIGHPANPEYALCAVSEDGELVCDEEEHKYHDKNWLQGMIEKELEEAKRRREVYLEGKKKISPKDKIAIVVDDGIATGLTMNAVVHSIRKDHPKKIVIAVPVAPREVISKLGRIADEVVVLDDSPHYLGAVGAYYDDFPQVSDREVIELLKTYRLYHLKKI